MKTPIAAILVIAASLPDVAFPEDTVGSACNPFVISAGASYEEAAALVALCRRSLRERLSGSAGIPATVASAAAMPDPETTAPRCALDGEDWRRAASSSCRKCHVSSGSTHPVDLDYAKAHARKGRKLRPAQTVAATGVNLPDGEIRCVTCHAGSSSARYRIALPSGAVPRPGREWAQGARSRIGSGRPLIEATPLCNACHTTADDEGGAGGDLIVMSRW